MKNSRKASDRHGATGKRMVWYGRCSSDRQEASIDDQWAWALARSESEGFEIVGGRQFVDDGIPGDEVRRRKGLLALFEFVEGEQRAGRPVDGIVLWDRDRLSRADSIKAAVILDRLREAGLSWSHTHKKGWEDLHDTTSNTINNLEQDFGRAGYVKSISANVSRTLADLAKKGNWPMGRPPYGYKTVGPKYGRKLALDDRDGGVRHQTVLWIFQQYVARDTSCKELARELTERGVPSPNAGWAREVDRDQWTGDEVKLILRNPTYTGAIVFPRVKTGKYHTIRNGEPVAHRPSKTCSGDVSKRKARPDEQIVVRDAHEAVVSDELFNLAQSTRTARAPTFKAGTTRKTFSLFAKLLRCGRCGQVLWADRRSRGGGEQSYTCSTYVRHGRDACPWGHPVREAELLGHLGAAIGEYFGRPDALDQLRETIRQHERALAMDGPDAIAALRQRAASLEQQVEQGTARIARIPDDLLEGLVKQLRQWKDQLAEVQGLIAAMNLEAQTSRDMMNLAEKAMVEFQHLPDTIHLTDPAILRTVVRNLVGEIKLYFRRVDDGQPREYSRSDGKTIVVPGNRKHTHYRLSHGTIETTPIAQLFGLPAHQKFSNGVHSFDCTPLLKTITIEFRAA